VQSPDLFGSGNFSVMSFTQAQARMEWQVRSKHTSSPPRHSPQLRISHLSPQLTTPASSSPSVDQQAKKSKTIKKHHGSTELASSGSDGSPRMSSRKERFMDEELLQDENIEVLGGGRTRHKSKGNRKKDLSKASEFSNLGFMDDKDPDELEPRSESHLNLSVDALRTSNTANFLGEGCHTLPRAGKSKAQSTFL
jgi:hypothetical protein